MNTACSRRQTRYDESVINQQKPRIAVPVPTSSNEAYNARCWPQYAAALESAGATAVEVALHLSPAETAKLVSTCSGILLPGSPADVHPQKYGEVADPETAPADASREATDELLLQDAFNLRKPLLGICFGMQMMNVWRGGNLVQHIRTGYPHTPTDKSPTLNHELTLALEASMLKSYFQQGGGLEINSSHHQAVDRPGDGLLIAAHSSLDKVVEAVESADPSAQWVLGVQWHPERTFAEQPASAAIFRSFAQAAREWQLPYA